VLASLTDLDLVAILTVSVLVMAFIA